jgi:hypothetical protein
MAENEVMVVSDAQVHELGLKGLPERNDELSWCVRRDVLERAQARNASSAGS